MQDISSASSARVVVVTGLSGAGRSTVLRALEDLGFYCVDNLPPSVFASTLEACERGNLRRVALGIDVRIRTFLGETLAAIRVLEENAHCEFTLVYLHASDAALLARYSATRRPHPLRAADSESAPSLAVLDGIHLETERLTPLRASAGLVIDTSDLTVHDLRRRITEAFRPTLGVERRMFTRFVSFGFKFGAPADLDLQFDVRFLENPYFVPALRPLSGREPAVAQYVLSQTSAQTFLEHLRGLLTFLVPAYDAEGKSYLTVGLGCTGGRHRSVAIAEALASELKANRGFDISVVHRDVDREHHAG